MDRLDYTKGLVARMRALQRLFEKYPKWIGKVQLIQVAVPSRTDVVEYKVSALECFISNLHLFCGVGDTGSTTK